MIAGVRDGVVTALTPIVDATVDEARVTTSAIDDVVAADGGDTIGDDVMRDVATPVIDDAVVALGVARRVDVAVNNVGRMIDIIVGDDVTAADDADE